MGIEEEKREFLQLLDDGHNEQAYQAFLENNTRFIPREFEQNHGIHLRLVLRKMAFGADYKTDFFYFSKSSDDWNAVFIEIEKPSSRFFKGNTNEFHSDFTKALHQLNQWEAWFRSDQNKGTFLSMVSAIQVPHHMASNPTYNKYVLVFGRRSEYAGNTYRRDLVGANESSDFKIITFDSLAEALSGKYHVSIGSRHNQFIDILTDEVTDPGLYYSLEPTQLRVSKVLHDKLENGPHSNVFVIDANRNKVEALRHAAPLVRIRMEIGNSR